MGQSDQEQKEERDGGEQRVKREGARQKGDVVFVGGLQRAEEEAAR